MNEENNTINESKTLYITIGLPSSGKSTYAKQKSLEPNTVILDSDEIRKSLFGFEDQNNNQLVFETMNRLTKENLKNGKNVVYCATNLNRKRRMNLLKELKDYYNKVVACMFYVPINEILHRNMIRIERKIPYDILENMIKSIDIPLYLEGYDNIYLFKEERFDRDYIFDNMSYLENYNQDNEYHNETLWGHTLTTVDYIYDNYLETKYYDDLRTISYYHDLGKLYTRCISNKGSIAYYGHEKVSAYIFMGEIDNTHITPQNDLVSTIIAYHMALYTHKDNLDGLKELLGDKYEYLLMFNKADKYRKETE